ncbi:hypothetical protein OHS58_03770 [Amycolatopsis sp. NBC_00348]|uniref:hypothetical protein n=1 Tax=Amycolatopsis sp. NBC_00348 TaxID=2975956 RepID=UPI002E275C41
MIAPERSSSPDSAIIGRAVSVIMGTVVGLTFLFGFGNVLSLALRLGVPVWVAPLVAPAVDLSILGLLLGTRHLALAGASRDVLRPARRLLIFASVVTLALNVAEPLVVGEYGKAAFDAVGPLLLIGWSEVGAGLLQAIVAVSQADDSGVVPNVGKAAEHEREKFGDVAVAQIDSAEQADGRPLLAEGSLDALLDRARREDAAHRAEHQKPISADTLRVRLRVGAGRARRLVKIIRAEKLMELGTLAEVSAELGSMASAGSSGKLARSRP